MSQEVIPTRPTNLVGIIGPTGDYDPALIERVSQVITQILVECDLLPIINPTVDAAPELFGEVYTRTTDRELWGLTYPRPDGFPAYLGQNRALCTNERDCGSWEQQPKLLAEYTKHTKRLVCLGICTGAVWEMCLTKYYWNSDGRILVLRETESERLPPRLDQRLGIEYLYLSRLRKRLSI